ncbi:MAG: bifunctional glycosyltransferase family 2/GtrA family protein [Bryobacteraceae bacterium]
MNLVVVIPAFRPAEALVSLVRELSGAGWAGIVVVNDGSEPRFNFFFESVRILPGVTVLSHAVNLGKGAALKTGIDHAMRAFPGMTGVVTADADGQHVSEDIGHVGAALADDPSALWIGSRGFEGGVPLRSRIGNSVTRCLVKAVLGRSLRDTQSGLRGIPAKMLPDLLRIESSGYEFELDMLTAAKHQNCAIRELPIRTIYEPGNPTSHFNPLRDSAKITFVLFRFGLLSLTTAALDNVVFYLAFEVSDEILLSQALGRALGVVFNYGLARRAVFLSGDRHRSTLPRYLVLVAASGLVSFGLIHFLMYLFELPVMVAKITAESGLFLANFAVQRDFVFTRAKSRSGVVAAEPAGAAADEVVRAQAAKAGDSD